MIIPLFGTAKHLSWVIVAFLFIELRNQEIIRVTKHNNKITQNMIHEPLDGFISGSQATAWILSDQTVEVIVYVFGSDGNAAAALVDIKFKESGDSWKTIGKFMHMRTRIAIWADDVG